MENWDDYRFILALYRTGVLRGAADELGVNHSTVSRRFAVLNDQYGAPLFERTVSGYRATPLGERMAVAAEEMERITFAADRQQRASEPDIAGSITLSIPVSVGQYLLLDDLKHFCEQYPAVDLSILCSYQFADLDRSEADVVVRATNTPPEHLVGRRLFPYALSYYCRSDYLANREPREIGWIVPPLDGNWSEWLAQTPYPDAPIAMVIDDIAMRHEAILAGHGMCRAACYMADPDPRLVRLPGARVLPQHDLWVLTHPDLKQSPRIRVLMQFIASALNKKRDLITGLQPA